MKAKDLFTIILKVFGIYLIKDVLISIPLVFDTFYKFLEFDAEVAVFSLLVTIFTLGCYIGIVYLLLFKTNWIISKLRLTSELSDEPFIINIHRASVFTIAIIISGLIILTFAIPNLVREIYAWYQYLDLKKRFFGNEYYDFGRLLVALTEVLIGFLFLGNQKTLVNFIESRRRKSKHI